MLNFTAKKKSKTELLQNLSKSVWQQAHTVTDEVQNLLPSLMVGGNVNSERQFGKSVSKSQIHFTFNSTTLILADIIGKSKIVKFFKC